MKDQYIPLPKFGTSKNPINKSGSALFESMIFEDKEDTNLNASFGFNNLPTDPIEIDQLVDRVQNELKQEFFGIDEQIDGLCTHFKTWLKSGNIQLTPYVINLWGMTGVGKTDLLLKLLKKAGINSFYHFDSRRLLEDPNAIINELSEFSDRKMVVIFDEFQHLKSITNGPMDNNGAMPEARKQSKIWELIENGKLRRPISGLSALKSQFQQILKIKGFKSKFGTLKLLQPIDGFNIWEDISDYTKSKNIDSLDNYFKAGVGKDVSTESAHKRSEYFVGREHLKFGVEEEGDGGIIFELLQSQYPSIGIDYDIVSYNYDYHRSKVYDKHIWIYLPFPDISSHLIKYIYPEFNFAHELYRGWDYATLMDKIYTPETTVYEFYQDLVNRVNRIPLQQELDYSKSMIINIGNLDEMYSGIVGDHSTIDADIFYEITKKLNVVNAKDSLKKYFRNEQISRLGNIHIIYPSISKNAYQQIIKSKLDKSIKTFANETGISFKVDQSYFDLFYYEAVVPTQGVRTINSTLTYLFHNLLSNIITILPVGEYTLYADRIKLFVKNGEDIVYEQDANLIIRKLKNELSDDQKIRVAVHEAGHGIVYYLKTGLVPQQMILEGAEFIWGANGVMLENIKDTKNLLTKDIIDSSVMCDLAGMQAEKVVFNNYTTGNYSDITHATARLTSWYGANDFIGIEPYNKTRGMLYSETLLEEINKEVIDSIRNLHESTYSLLSKYKSELLRLADLLYQKGALSNDDLNQFFKDIPTLKQTTSELSQFKNLLDEANKPRVDCFNYYEAR